MDAKRLDFSIAESYLTGALRIFDSALAAYILGKKVNGKSSA